MHRYDAEVKLINLLAKAMGGIVNGNFIMGDNKMYEGTHFVLEVDESITAVLIDTTYKEEVLIQYRNKNANFIGLYFYLTNLDVDLILNRESTLVGKLNHNLSIVDCSVNLDFHINIGTRIFVICIMLNKDAMKKYFSKMPKIKSIVDLVFDGKKNAISCLDRMGIENLILINDFRKIAYTSSLYKVYFKALVYGLIGNYLKQLNTKKVNIDKVINGDIKKIIASKILLLSFVEEPFPGIIFLAEQAGMSPSKYKKIFTKISGQNPGTYFYNNKLNKAREMLGTGKFTVSEVAQKLNYANVSYLAKRFNVRYGVFPKEYQSLL